MQTTEYQRVLEIIFAIEVKVGTWVLSLDMLQEVTNDSK